MYILYTYCVYIYIYIYIVERKLLLVEQKLLPGGCASHDPWLRLAPHLRLALRSHQAPSHESILSPSLSLSRTMQSKTT